MIICVYNIIFSRMTSFSLSLSHPECQIGFFPLPSLGHGDCIDSSSENSTLLSSTIFSHVDLLQETACFLETAFWQQRKVVVRFKGFPSS